MTATARDFDLSMQCESMFSLSPLPMAAVDVPNHIIRYVNLAFCQLCGKKAKDLVGHPLSDVLDSGPLTEDATAIPDGLLTLLDFVAKTGEARTHSKGENSLAPDSLCWSCALWPVRATGGIAGVMIQVTETTAFHRLATSLNQALMVATVHQHELTEAAVTMNEQLQTEVGERKLAEQSLQRSNQALQQFAFASSHDLQAPLRGITIYAQLLLKRHGHQLDGKAREYLLSISDNAKQMRNLLADLLAYAEAGTETAEAIEAVNLNAVCEAVKQMLRPAIEESGAVVTHGDLPTVNMGAVGFVQLFQNLIGNAIKYRGEVPPRVDVSAELRGHEWQFTVADNGIGIAPEYHEQVFGVFKRLHGNEISGTGIGLAICQRVVQRWGGRIWVESAPGLGSRFCFTFPA